jgi:hypothetical protein
MPRKKRSTRVHSVTANLHVVDLTKAGTSLTLEMFRANRKLGTLVIGRGSVTWSGHNRRYVKVWSWSRFTDLMNREAYGE